MFYKARFKVDGNEKEYNVHHVDYGFEQATSPSGHPTTSVTGGKATITVEATEDLFLLKWMVESHHVANATIEFMHPNEEQQVAKEVKFNNAFCVSYQKSFDKDHKDHPSLETITITAKEFAVKDIEHHNDWTGDFL